MRRSNKLTRPTTDLFERDGSVLDVNDLHRHGAFSRPLYFPFQRLTTFPDRIEIKFPLPNKSPEVFLIARTRMHFGGTRPWFLCHCGRRCGKLYVTTIHAACQHCAELGFKSQRQWWTTRLRVKADKIRARLDTDKAGKLIRPRYMHQTTYRQHINALQLIQRVIATGSRSCMIRYRRQRERDSDGRYCAKTDWQMT